MLTLGLDTSCDETAAAVVADGSRVLSNIVWSQVADHAAYGGVVPEMASRLHLRNVRAVVRAALDAAGVEVSELDLVAATNRPGLVGALLVGWHFAKALAYARELPLVAVDHLLGHVHAHRMQDPPVADPFVCLLASGGHTDLYLCEGPLEVELLGTTLDDAAGEAFDKVAAILELGYPGGPSIDRAAEAGRPDAVPFKRPFLQSGDLDFSFSGIKTAVLYHARGQGAGRNAPLLPEVSVPDVAASFQEAVVDVLVAKTVEAARQAGCTRVAIGGGVACNRRLRERIVEAAGREGLEAHLPPPPLCTDNAAMIAGLGHHYAEAGEVADLAEDAVPGLRRVRYGMKNRRLPKGDRAAGGGG